MAIAAIPAAAWWALGSAAAGGAAAHATGHDWKKGAALGALGGLGLSSLLGAGAAGAGAGSGAAAGSALGETAELGLGAADAGAGLGATTAVASPASSAAADTFLTGALKQGAVNGAMTGLQSSMQPDVTTENPQPFSLQQIDPNTVFQIIEALKQRRATT